MVSVSQEDMVNWWLDHEEKRRAGAKLGQDIALEKYTWDATVGRTIE